MALCKRALDIEIRALGARVAIARAAWRDKIVVTVNGKPLDKGKKLSPRLAKLPLELKRAGVKARGRLFLRCGGDAMVSATICAILYAALSPIIEDCGIFVDNSDSLDFDGEILFSVSAVQALEAIL